MNDNIKTQFSEKTNLYLRVFILFYTFGFFTTQAQAQSLSNAPTSIELSVGAMYSHAPTLAFDRYEGTGNFITVFGDLEINNKIIGRLLFSSLQTPSLSSELSNNVDAGYVLAGAVGYNFSPGPKTKLSVPVMISGGFAEVFRSDNFTEQGMQVGLIIAPAYEITTGLSAVVSLRYLKGLEVADGAAIDATDIGLGVKYTFLSN